MNTKNSITDIKTEILVKQNWNWNNCLIEIEMEIHCKTIIETELKYIVNNGIEIETEIYLINGYNTVLHLAMVKVLFHINSIHIPHISVHSRFLFQIKQVPDLSHTFTLLHISSLIY